MSRTQPNAGTSLTALQELTDETLGRLRSGDVAGLAPVPALSGAVVRLSGRLTSSAGMYRPPGDIAISTHYLSAHGIEAIGGVLMHEIAHHVVRHVTGARVAPHGREFRLVAAALGGSLKAAPFAAPRTVYVYRCPTCRRETVRGRRFSRGRRYSCARCAPAYDPRFRLVYVTRRRQGTVSGSP